MDFPPPLSLRCPYNAGRADPGYCHLCRKAHLQPDFLFADELLGSLLETSANTTLPSSALDCRFVFFFLTVTPAAITNLAL